MTPQTGKLKQESGQRSRAQQQPQPEAAIALAPSSEVSSYSNAETIDNADDEHAKLLPPLPHQPNNQPDLGQAPEQLPRRSLQTHYPQSTIEGLNASLHQISSPASPMQLSDVRTSPANCYAGLTTVPNTAPEAIFTPQHMILLHHVHKVPNFAAPYRSVVDIAIRHIIGSPYLLDEVLAFTAFHMTHLYPRSAVYLRPLATELQTRALASFNSLTAVFLTDDKPAAVPRFLFSSILGRHVLADALTYCHSNLHLFIDRFVECIHLNRGIRAVTPSARDFLKDTEIRPFLDIIREAEEKIVSSGTECDPLSRLMDDSDLNETSIKACRGAIKVLQWSFNLCHGLDVDDYPQAASVFSVRLESGFLDVLRKHQPESLVILAYYGVLLYRCRTFWAFTDAGAALIRAITCWLGSSWQGALAWPLHVLGMEGELKRSSPLPNS